MRISQAIEKTKAALSRFVLFLCLNLLLSSNAMADSSTNRWSISGQITDIGMAGKNPIFTNTFSLTGHYDDGQFLLDLVPIKSIVDVAESVGWDGKVLRLIARWSDIPNETSSRTNSIAYIEPTVFSRYSSYSLQSILVAFADSNSISNLEKGLTPVILGPMRTYPEEYNTYQVKHQTSGYTEIEATSPGLELGLSGLVPIKGFEQGFTRWTHRSNFADVIGLTNGIREFFVEYNRYSPVNKKLIQIRAVTGKFVLQQENQDDVVFRPKITEQKLTVKDYSSRFELDSWTKGAADWCCFYDLANQNWNFDTNKVRAQVSQVKENMKERGGYPKDLLAVANTVYAYKSRPAWGIHRIAIICFMVGFSIFTAGALWIGSRR
jgi:hypothetical protein